MNRLLKILLVYGALFALIITVIGVVTSKNTESLVTQLVFLPVTLYFVTALASEVRQWLKRS